MEDKILEKISRIKSFRELFNDDLIKNYCKPINGFYDGYVINDYSTINKGFKINDLFIVLDCDTLLFYEGIVGESMEKKSSDYIRLTILKDIMSNYVEFGSKQDRLEYDNIINTNIDDIDDNFVKEKIIPIVKNEVYWLNVLNDAYDVVAKMEV